MGFCIYCNQNVYSNTTCPKCYRTIPVNHNKSNKNDSLSSRATAMFPEQKILKNNTDKWQDTYGKKAIFNGSSSNTPISRQRPRMIPQFGPNDSINKAPVSPSPENSSISTPVLSSMAASRSSLTSSSSTNKSNAYFQYQRTRRTSMFSHTNLPQEGPEQRAPTSTSAVSTSTIVTSPIIGSPTKSPILNKITEENSNLLKYKRESLAAADPSQPTPSASTIKLPNLVALNSSVIEPKPSQSTPRKRKVVKKPCKECGQHVHKKDYRGLKIHTGEVLCFHNYCLFCAKCHQNFNGLEFCTDGKKFYHTECPTSRQSTPLSEEEESYPQTPPPNSHATHFDIADQTDSPIDITAFSENDLPKKQIVITPNSIRSAATTTIMCNTCTLPVTDSTCLELANNFYHKECLLCTGCKKTVPTDRRLSKYQDKLYCDNCTPASKTTTATKRLSGLQINVNTAQELPKRNPTITTPSDIFKSRKKNLPRLGGVRTCARCNESMPFSDTQPGPNASRWHKKCLCCTGCKKQMDSDAHMTVDDKTGLCLVHCRECLDDTPKPRFVR